MSTSSNTSEISEVNVLPGKPETVYRSLLLCGASLSVVDDRLRVGPVELLTPIVRDSIARHRDALIRLVEAETGLNDTDAQCEISEESEVIPGDVDSDPKTWPGEFTPELEALLQPEWFVDEPVAVHLLSDDECRALSRYSVLTGDRYEVEPTPDEYLPTWPDRSAA